MEGVDAVAMVSRLLIQYGPLEADELVARLRADGVADPESVSRDGLDEILSPAGQLADDRWVWLPALLAGRVFTHRVTDDELTHDLLVVTPDLNPISELCEHEQYQVLADGSPVSLVLSDYDDEVLDERGVPAALVDLSGALLLAIGTLGALDVVAGDLVGVRLSDSGLVIERITTVDSSSDVGPVLASFVAKEEPTLLDSAVWSVCVAAPMLFTRPLPPVGDIVAECGLEHDSGWIAPQGFDIAGWRFERRCERLARQYEIEFNEAAALLTLVNVYDSVAEVLDAMKASADDDERPDAEADDVAPPDPDDYREVVAAASSLLSDPLLAEVLLQEISGRGGDPAALGLFAETLEPQVSRSARPAYRWLRATALDQMGDVAAAEREYSAAESMDTEFWPALFDLARYAADRGDVERGLALLHRAGAEPDHPLVQVLQLYRVPPRTDVGRNDPCWCGSGRKYKKCHLGNERLPIEERANWLYLKASQHVVHTQWHDLMEEVAEARGIHQDPEALDPPIVDDPLIIDAVLFEGGAFEDFLATRGSLLPDDERLLAEQWLLAERTVFDVEAVRRGQSVNVRDVRTGDVVEVHERTASEQLAAGQLICARVLPVGEEFQFFGGIEPVALHDRNALIELLDAETDPVDLVDFLSRRFAPPTLVNTEGDPLVICEATVRVDDPERIVAALDVVFDRSDDDEPLLWHDLIDAHGAARIGASLTLDGYALTVRTNGEARMDRTLETLTRLDPSASVVNDARTPITDAREFARMAPMAARETPDDPEIAAAFDEVIRGKEAAWLDERIPALDGHTPRQAADDPTRRDDLIRLLDSFPHPAGGMDADRLRAALGL